MIGTTLSHYSIEAELGRGGMGIVYKARDTKLDRTVAIKVLPSAALASEDDRERFYREAKSAAQLHHPNIASVFEIDEAVPSDAPHGTQPSPFIAMEFIAGATLEDKIKEAPLSLADAVKVTSQVAEALKAAHDKDIVHRDIKSANVMITEEGVAKVLDFGLAKTNTSTMLTRMGSTLGTVAYMSPEQAKGQEVDGRSDLYSLGTMLFEMVAGALPFAGEYEQAVVYGILNESPEPLTAKRTGVPMQLEWIVNKLLAKDADYRYQSAAGLLADLKTLDLSGSGNSMRSMPASTSMHSVTTLVEQSSPNRKLLFGGIALGCFLVGTMVMWFFQPELDPGVVRKLNVRIERVLIEEIDISSDGRYWAIPGVDSSGVDMLSVLDLNTGQYHNTLKQPGFSRPRFSPDGNWLLIGNGSEIRYVLVPSGSPVPIGIGGSSYAWVTNRKVAVTDQSSVLSLFDLDSQETETIDLSEADTSLNWVHMPEVVPGTDVLLMTASIGSGNRSIVQFDVSSHKLTFIHQNACCARALSKDALVYNVESEAGQVVGQKYDVGLARLTGTPIDLIGSEVFNRFWAAGADGTFMYIEGATFDEDDIVERFDTERGTNSIAPIPMNQYDRGSISPDGSKIVLEVGAISGLNGKHLSVFDLQTGVEQRLTYQHEISRAPSWSSDGRIYYSINEGNDSPSIYAKSADGTGPEEMVVELGDYPHASRDGKWLVYSGSSDLRAMNLESREVIIIDSTMSKQGDPKFSPDGRYIAFTADSQTSQFVSGEQRLFVRSFPDPNQFYEQVSEIYADDPEWSKDGDKLFFRNRGSLFELPVDISGVFRKMGNSRQIQSVAGINTRITVDPVSGDLLVMHPPSSTAGLKDTHVSVTENLPLLIDRLTNQK